MSSNILSGVRTLCRKEDSCSILRRLQDLQIRLRSLSELGAPTAIKVVVAADCFWYALLSFHRANNTDMDEYFDAPPESEEPNIAPVLREMGISANAARRLTGGFQNWNFLIQAQGRDRFVLRVAKDPEALEKEVKLLSRIGAFNEAVPVPKIIWHDGRSSAVHIPCAAMTFMPGPTLWTTLKNLSKAEQANVSQQLGAILAHIHAVRFPAFGFLDINLVVSEPAPSYKEWTAGFIERCFDDPRFNRRLERDVRHRLQVCIRDRADLQDPASQPCLCHGDFNEKNILLSTDSVGAPKISAVLDWEFALAGAPQIDIGNLFRFSAISHWIDPERFERGYRGAGGILDPHWVQRARFTDLVSLCNFLISHEERPRTFATAATLIKRTLDDLAVASE